MFDFFLYKKVGNVFTHCFSLWLLCIAYHVWDFFPASPIWLGGKSYAFVHFSFTSPNGMFSIGFCGKVYSIFFHLYGWKKMFQILIWAFWMEQNKGQAEGTHIKSLCKRKLFYIFQMHAYSGSHKISAFQMLFWLCEFSSAKSSLRFSPQYSIIYYSTNILSIHILNLHHNSFRFLFVAHS